MIAIVEEELIMTILELSNIMEQGTEIFVKVIDDGKEVTIPLTN